MAEKVLIIKYGEIAMRGNNRYLFINRLISAIRRNIDPFGKYYVVRDPGRLIVEDRGGELDYDLLIPKLKTIFGLAAICPGVRLKICHLRASAKKACCTCRNSAGIRK